MNDAERVGFGHRFHEREAKPRSRRATRRGRRLSFDRSRREEAIEDARQILLRDAGSAVGHRQRDVVARALDGRLDSPARL